MKISIIAGTRPEVVKLAPVHGALRVIVLEELQRRMHVDESRVVGVRRQEFVEHFAASREDKKVDLTL